MENENPILDNNEQIIYDHSLAMSLENFIEFTLIHNKEQFKKTYLLLIVIMSILILVSIYFESYIFMFAFVVGFIVAILSLKSGMIKAWKKIFEKTYKDKNLVSDYKFAEYCIYSINYYNGVETKAKLPYKNIERAYETTNIIVIYLNKMMAHVIPKDQVSNLNELLEFLRKNIHCFCKEEDVKFKIR